MRPRDSILLCLLALGLSTARAGAQPQGDRSAQESTPAQADEGPAEAPDANPDEAPDANPDEDPVTRARTHYARAEAAMSQGDYTVAAAEYERAHALTPDPVLLFKIAGAYDRAGRCEAARTYYQRYLDEGTSDGSARSQAEERMRACTSAPAAAEAETAAAEAEAEAETAAAETEAAGTGTPPGADLGAGPPSFADQEPSWQRSAAWVSVGATAALVTAGAMLALSAESREEDLDYLLRYRALDTDEPARYDGQVRERYEELVREGDRLELYSRLVLGAAGVAAASAVVLFLVDPSSPSSPAPAERRTTARHRIAPALLPGGLGIVAGWEL